MFVTNWDAVLERRKLALFVTTCLPDESHNFVLVQVFTVVKPALGGGLSQGNLLFSIWLDHPGETLDLQRNIIGLTIRGCIRSIVSSEAISALLSPLLPLLFSVSSPLRRTSSSVYLCRQRNFHLSEHPPYFLPQSSPTVNHSHLKPCAKLFQRRAHSPY